LNGWLEGRTGGTTFFFSCHEGMKNTKDHEVLMLSIRVTASLWISIFHFRSRYSR